MTDYMLEKLRAELKAIQEWDRSNFQIETQTELDAIPIHQRREAELIRKIREIAALN
jgi:hypothetical protein